ncbi:MAG TPA: nitrilase-related carbon-nitrogen hydrolase [Thermoleophilaceae bacterium]|nr:nitrilase-related carbon-nitrogen hydrolase [Thermoleophilaceae bacterium]
MENPTRRRIRSHRLDRVPDRPRRRRPGHPRRPRRRGDRREGGPPARHRRRRRRPAGRVARDVRLALPVEHLGSSGLRLPRLRRVLGAPLGELGRRARPARRPPRRGLPGARRSLRDRRERARVRAARHALQHAPRDRPRRTDLEPPQADADPPRAALPRHRRRRRPDGGRHAARPRRRTDLCWENRMPLARWAVYRQGPQIWVAPTADDSDAWLASMRHIAIESGAFVVSAPQYIPRAAFSDDFPVELPDKEVFGRGGAAIVEPGGEVVAGPLYDEEGMVVADCDLRLGLHAKRSFDAVGHYSRGEVLAPPPAPAGDGGEPPVVRRGSSDA